MLKSTLGFAPLALFFIVFAGDASPQDTCATAVPISGEGIESFSNFGLTTSGFTASAGCGLSQPIPFDHFFEWTATSAGSYHITAGSSFEFTSSRLAIYEGSDCNATCVGVDSSSLEIGFTLINSLILTDVQVGDQFLFQYGTNSFKVGPASLSVVKVADPFEPNETCASAPTLPLGPHTLFHTFGDLDYFQYDILPGRILSVSRTGGVPVRLTAYDGSGCANLLGQSDFQVSVPNLTSAPKTVTLRIDKSVSGPHQASYSILAEDSPACSSSGNIPDVYEDNDDCPTAFPLETPGVLQQTIQLGDPDLFRICVPNGSTVWSNIVAEENTIRLRLWDAADVACGQPAAALASSSNDGFGDESLGWTNNTGVNAEYILGVELLNTVNNPEACKTYSLAISGNSLCDSSTTSTICDPMDPNSTGQPTQLAGSFTAAAGSGLHLEASSGPPGQFGYTLVSSRFLFPNGTPIGNGRLCLDLSFSIFGRYNFGNGAHNSLGYFDSLGIFQNLTGTSTTGTGFDVPSTLPTSTMQTIQAGHTWYFQLWHRENNGESNFSNGVIALF